MSGASEMDKQKRHEEGPYQRWITSEAPFKAMCPDGLCISFEHIIDCKTCKQR